MVWAPRRGAHGRSPKSRPTPPPPDPPPSISRPADVAAQPPMSHPPTPDLTHPATSPPSTPPRPPSWPSAVPPSMVRTHIEGSTMPTRAPRWTRHTLAEGHGVGSGSPGLGCRRGIGWPWIPECPLPRGRRGRGKWSRTTPTRAPDSARPARPRQKTAPHDRCCFWGVVLPSGATKNPRHHWPHALTTPLAPL